MRKYLVVLTFFLFSLNLVHASSKVLVKFRHGSALAAAHTFNKVQAQGVSTFRIIPQLYELKFNNEKEALKAINYFKKNSEIAYAELDHKVFLINKLGDEFPFPWPGNPDNGDGEFPFPWPWDPGDGDGEFPFPWPWDPGDGDDPFPWPFPDPNPTPVKDPDLILNPEPIVTPAPDADLSKSWGIGKIKAPEAWEISKGSRDVVVAVIDTGIDYNHEDLALNVWRNPGESGEYKDEKTGETKRRETDKVDNDNNGFIDDVVGWDFANNDALPFDDHNHGTHVSGTIGAVGQNGKGTAGVNEVVSIMGLKFLSAGGSGDVSAAIKAIEYAAQNGARVMSNSWGDYENSQALEDAIKAIQEKNILFVAAAGNDSLDNDGTRKLYPASYTLENIISVASSTDDDSRSFFSHWGKTSVDIAAPGSHVYSSVAGGKYEYFDGTSMATPHVAGAAALLLSIDKKLTYKEIADALFENVDKIDSWKDKIATAGRLNIFNAAKYILERKRVITN